MEAYEIILLSDVSVCVCPSQYASLLNFCYEDYEVILLSACVSPLNFSCSMRSL
jgi:hypothetical protein